MSFRLIIRQNNARTFAAMKNKDDGASRRRRRLSRPFSKQAAHLHMVCIRNGCGPSIFSYVGICKSERVRVADFYTRFFGHVGCR